MKKIFISFFIFLFSFKAYSQVEYMHSAGGSLYIDIDLFKSIWQGINYHARLNLVDVGPLTLDVSSRPGFGIYYDQYYGGYIGFDVPLFVSLNGGLASSTDNTDNFGYFLGAGFDYNNLVSYWKIIGPAATGGIRFYLQDTPVELHMGYTGGVGETKTKLIELGAMYVLGFN